MKKPTSIPDPSTKVSARTIEDTGDINDGGIKDFLRNKQSYVDNVARDLVNGNPSEKVMQ